jgi:catechol 2,3-dioxygenase-like lactoylglutathione lyase family enzyme
MAEMTARLDHVGLAVADLGAAAAWYCDVFGLVPELSLRVDAIDLSIEMLIHPAFGYRVELLHRPGTGAVAAAGHAAVPGAGTRGADGLRRRSRGQPRRASG